MPRTVNGLPVKFALRMRVLYTAALNTAALNTAALNTAALNTADCPAET